MWDKNGVLYRECIVGNIIGKHYWGEKKEIKYGTKHFRPGTKVYCAFIYDGMGNKNVMVMGKPRKSFRKIEVVLRRDYIKNFRVEKIYSPQIIAFIDKHSNGMALDQGLIQLVINDFNNECNEISEAEQ